MARYAAMAVWWLSNLILVGLFSPGPCNGAWAAEIADANDYARTASIGRVEVDKNDKESANKDKNDDKDKNDQKDKNDDKDKNNQKDKNDQKEGPDNKADPNKDAGSTEVNLWSMPEAIANITGQAPIVDWQKYLTNDPFGEEGGVGPIKVNDFVGGSTWPFTSTCLNGDKMEVAQYGQELCIGVGEGICIDGWNFGIRYHDLNTYVMLWKDGDDGSPAYKWFPGALQLCVGEQRLFGGHKVNQNDEYKSPSVDYLRVVYDRCHYYLIGPGTIDAGKFAKLKISEDKEKDKPLEVKFSKLWKMYANGNSETNPDAIWYPIPCDSWYFGSSNPSDLISLSGPLDENNVLPSTSPMSSPTSRRPTTSPSAPPLSASPTRGPTSSPVSDIPTRGPSAASVSDHPTRASSSSPVSDSPTNGPSATPVSTSPTDAPVTLEPSAKPTSAPVVTEIATKATEKTPVPPTPAPPTPVPSAKPTTASPTAGLTLSPMSESPTARPTPSPISNQPTKTPSTSPTKVPSASPTKSPSQAPVSSPPTAAPFTPAPSSGPTKAPVSISTSSPTRNTSTNLRAGTQQTSDEPAGYELRMTTPKEAWMWTRDYSTCNRRLEVWEDQGDEEASTANNQKGFRWGFKNRFRGGDDEEEGVGDDIGAHTNGDMDYAVFGERSKEVKTSERVFVDIGGDDIVEVDKNDKNDKNNKDDKPAGDAIDADKENTNKENDKACAPAVFPEGRASATSMTATQTCPSKFSPFSGPITVSRLDGKAVPESSGICASRINPNTIWSINDYSNQATLHAVNSTDGSIRQYPIAGGKNYDYEDIACGPGPIPDVAYIYAADIGDNMARRGFKYYFGLLTWQPVIIYRVREPNLSTLQDSKLTQWDKLEITYSDGPHNAEAMMIDPVSRRIFIITKSSGSIWMTPEPWGEGDAKMTLTKVGMIKAMPDFLTGIDISPDGKEIVVKFYSHIFYFCMGSRQYDNPEGAWQDIVDVLTMDDGIKVPYIAEPQGEALCFGSTFDEGIFTLSEAQDREFVPLIHHVRL